jgi:bleomycin hydrolase
VNHLADDLISDGGQWDMVVILILFIVFPFLHLLRQVNLIENYGVVPQVVYPESTHSSLSGPLNALLKTKLREHALILRRLHSSLRAEAFSEETILSALRAKKEEVRFWAAVLEFKCI